MAFDGDTDTELDSACDAVGTERKFGGGGNLDKLPDGEHVFTVTDGELKKGKFVIYELKLSVTTADGQTFTGVKDYWLKGNDGFDAKRVNELKADLKALGFDVDLWTGANERPFTAELVKVKPVLAGLRFKGKKKQGSAKKNAPGEHYVYINVNERDTTDGKPEVLDAAAVAELLLGADADTPF